MFFMIKKEFFCRMNIYFRKIYILFVTQTFFCAKSLKWDIYFFNFQLFFFVIKSFFSVKNIFIIKLFFHIKTFLSANNVHFVKNKNIFSNLVLQQINNHILRPVTLLKKRLWHRCFPMNFVKFLRTPFFPEHLWTTAFY